MTSRQREKREAFRRGEVELLVSKVATFQSTCRPRRWLSRYRGPFGSDE